MKTDYYYAIRIAKCSDPQMWYADKIGQLVAYISETEDEYISREDAGYLNIVKKSDAELLKIEPQ